MRIIFFVEFGLKIKPNGKRNNKQMVLNFKGKTKVWETWWNLLMYLSNTTCINHVPKNSRCPMNIQEIILPLLLLKYSPHSSISLTRSYNFDEHIFDKQLKPAVNFSRGVFFVEKCTYSMPSCKNEKITQKTGSLPLVWLSEHRGASSRLWDVPVDLWQLVRVCDQVVETIEVGWGEKITKVSRGRTHSVTQQLTSWLVPFAFWHRQWLL